MGLYFVIRDNPYVDVKTYLEDIDEEFVQPVDLDLQGKPGVNYGLMIPKRNIRDSMVKLLSRGLDKRW